MSFFIDMIYEESSSFVDDNDTFYPLITQNLETQYLEFHSQNRFLECLNNYFSSNNKDDSKNNLEKASQIKIYKSNELDKSENISSKLNQNEFNIEKKYFQRNKTLNSKKNIDPTVEDENLNKQFISKDLNDNNEQIKSLLNDKTKKQNSIPFDPKLRIITICGHEHSGKKLLCNLLSKSTINFFPKDVNNVNHIEKRGIFYQYIPNPSKELQSMIEDKDILFLDSELESKIIQIQKQLNNQNTSDNKFGIMILLVLGVSSFVSIQNSQLHIQNRKILKSDPSLPDAIDAILLHFCYLISSTFVLNAPIYPNQHEKDLVSLSDVLGLWCTLETKLSWSNIVKDVVGPEINKIQVSNTINKSLRIDNQRKKLRPLKNISNNFKKKAPSTISINWKTEEISFHDLYFNSNEQPDFVYVIRDVSQLSPIDSQDYLSRALNIIPPGKDRRDRFETMRSKFQKLFPSSSMYLKKELNSKSPRDLIQEDHFDSRQIYSNINYNSVKGMHIYSPMLSNPTIQLFHLQSKAFRHSMSRLKYYLISKLNIKYLQGWPVSLFSFLHLAEYYVNFVNNNQKIPSILQFVEEIRFFVLKCLETNSLALYRQEKENIILPVSQKELINFHNYILPKIEKFINQETSQLPNSNEFISLIYKKIGKMIDLDFNSTMDLLKQLQSKEDIKVNSIFTNKNQSKIIHQPSSVNIISSWLISNNLLQNNHTSSAHTSNSLYSTKNFSNSFQLNSIQILNVIPSEDSFLTEAETLMLENSIESMKKSQSILYLIYSKNMKHLSKYLTLEDYENDFQKFVKAYNEYNNLGPAKKYVFETFLSKENGKLNLLGTLLKKKWKEENQNELTSNRFNFLINKLNDLESYIDIAKKYRSDEVQRNSLYQK